MEAGPRTIELPASGAVALRTALGILSDQGFVDASLDELDARLSAVWPEPTAVDLSSEFARGVELTMFEADLLLGSLRVTEMLSMELPWYEQLVETIHFIGDQLIALWSATEWMAFRSAHARRPFT
jgi:hypothetical protein